MTENCPKLDPRLFRSLIDRVGATKEIDRQLDADIDVALFGGETEWRQENYTMNRRPSTRRPSKMHVGGFAYDPVPFYSVSLDAALGAFSKALPGWGRSVDAIHPAKPVRVTLHGPDGQTVVADHAFMENLAVIGAVLRAVSLEPEAGH